MRDAINTALKEALKAQDKRRLSTLRLIQAAIKDRDIAVRSDGRDGGQLAAACGKLERARDCI